MNNIKSFREEYYFLSNFYDAPITYKGITYLNNEAAFQAQKCKSAYQYDKGEKPFTDERLQFKDLNATEAKKKGRSVSLRSDWENIKVSIMEDIVREKFIQNEDLRDKLLETKDAYLEEGNTWGDRVWGTVNGSGANLLGNILMKIRDELQKEYDDKENDYDLDI